MLSEGHGVSVDVVVARISHHDMTLWNAKVLFQVLGKLVGNWYSGLALPSNHEGFDQLHACECQLL